jgi:hypothetical protein
MENVMALFSIILFFGALAAAFGAIGLSIRNALPRIDAVIASRGAPVVRVIRVGVPRSGLQFSQR